MAFRSSGDMTGKLPVQIRQMAQLKIQRPGIGFIRHQHVQHGHRLQGREVARAVSHGTVGHFQQVLQQRPTRFIDAARSIREAAVPRYIARSSRRPRLMKSQPGPRVMFSRSMPEKAESSSRHPSSTAEYSTNSMYSSMRRRLRQLAHQPRHIRRKPLAKISAHPLHLGQRRSQTVGPLRDRTSARSARLRDRAPWRADPSAECRA